MSEVRDNLLYTDNNSWVEIKDGKAKFGLTDFSQNELGDLVYVELPAVGTEVKMNDEIGALESVKSVEPVYAPVSGKIIEINSKVAENPKIANASPYGDGWFAVIELSDPSEKDELLSAEQYRGKIV